MTGTLTDDQVIATADRVRASPYFPLLESELVDFTEVSELRITPSVLQQFAARNKASVRGSFPVHFAVVTAAKNGVALAEMYQSWHRISGGRWLIRSFPSESDARAWIAARPRSVQTPS